MPSFSFKSFRSRYLLVAIITAVSTFIFTTFIENYTSTANNINLDKVTKRHEVSRLNTQLYKNIQSASRMLDLYLLTPTTAYRENYLVEIGSINALITQLAEIPWIKEQELESKIEILKMLHTQLKLKSLALLKIRLDGKKMYPAMNLADGSMLNANKNIINLLNAAVVEQQSGNNYNRYTHAEIIELRDRWRLTINAYRRYLINRLSSLSESNLTDQSTDIRLYHQNFTNLLKKLKSKAGINSIGIDTATAIEDTLPHAKLWLSEFNTVDKINSTGAWRGDVPIILNSIYPLLDQIYAIINSISIINATSSYLDIKIQQQANKETSYILWSLEALLIFLIFSGYIILDRLLLKPLSNLSKSLRDSSSKNIDILLPHSQTQEIEDFVKAYQYMQNQINERQKELEHIAMHDDLTNLPNRALLINHIALSIACAHPYKTNFAIIILDLDRFKEVNDTLGHLVGDEILIQVAQRLKSLLRDSDTVARLGGDEFAILLNTVDEKTITDIAVKISQQLEQAYTVNEHNLYLGASQGIAIFPEHGTTKEALLKNADIAMYIAKKSNIDYVIYAPKDDEHNIRKLSLLSDLRKAIDKNQLELYYQPIFNTHSNKIKGFESLLRWQHPDYGLLTPDNFISKAEQTGLIKKITLWVIEKSLSTFKSLPIKHDEYYISINITSWDLQDNNFIQFLEKSLSHHNIKPECLILELSERSMMTNSSRIKISLEKLKELGVQISIDDFGTGFSSLSLLKELPVSILKIDKSFVMSMAKVKNDSLIVHSIIELAHNLELKVIAEGVEDTKSRDLLKEFKCDYCQGYLLSLPINKEHLLSLIDVMNNSITMNKPRTH